MRHKKLRGGVLAGLGAAAVMSAAIASSAHADDFTDIIANTQNTAGVAQTEFSNAYADFSTGLSGVPDGLEQLAGAENNGLVFTDADLVVGALNAVTNEPVEGPFTFAVQPAPTDLMTALTEVQGLSMIGQLTFEGMWNELANGHLADAAYLGLLGAFASYDLPMEQLLIGGIDQLLAL